MLQKYYLNCGWNGNVKALNPYLSSAQQSCNWIPPKRTLLPVCHSYNCDISTLIRAVSDDAWCYLHVFGINASKFRSAVAKVPT
ncbi:hypothetical protein J6590_063109 [Homalodisca vitripennis]|nr:hypothetical protein J6590_063109 [Homalodisca vitripennis]